ncbi:hypothetical protein M2427_001484 [Bradyrhizobium sp. BR13661]|jgi:hypothetical protein|nr:hypothetical protein [Bradyrhizobium sp. BR13661]
MIGIAQHLHLSIVESRLSRSSIGMSHAEHSLTPIAATKEMISSFSERERRPSPKRQLNLPGRPLLPADTFELETNDSAMIPIPLAEEQQTDAPDVRSLFQVSKLHAEPLGIMMHDDLQRGAGREMLNQAEEDRVPVLRLNVNDVDDALKGAGFAHDRTP